MVNNVVSIEPGVKKEKYFTSFVPYLYNSETEINISNTKNKNCPFSIQNTSSSSQPFTFKSLIPISKYNIIATVVTKINDKTTAIIIEIKY